MIAGFTESAFRLCYGWGPPLAALLIVGWAIHVRWKRSRRGFQGLLSGRLVFAACVISGLGVPVFYRYWGVPARFTQGETGILIGEVPGDRGREKQDSYARAIRDVAGGEPELACTVKVRLITRPLPAEPERQRQVAISIGRRLGASFVLRSFRAAGERECRLTIVNRPAPERPEAPVERFREIQPREMDEFPLPAATAMGARCVVAFCLYRRGRYREAANDIERIVETSQPRPGDVFHPYLTFVLGNCYYHLGSADGASVLRLAIAAYESAAREWPSGGYSIERAVTADNRATTCARLAELTGVR